MKGILSVLENEINRRPPLVHIHRLLLTLFMALSFSILMAGLVWPDVSEKPNVFVSILPQKFMIREIAGDLVEVNVLVGPGQSPATYEPTPRQMTALAEADLFFRIGVPFEEHLLEKIDKIFPEIGLVDTRNGIKLRSFNHEDHTADRHHHGGQDPHIWLDPVMVKIQAATIAATLKQIIPDDSVSLNAGYDDFCRRLDSLDQQIKGIIAADSPRTFLVFHPTFGYFADRYGLNQIAIEKEGKEPGIRHTRYLIELAGREKVKNIIVQPQFSTKSAEVVAASIGAGIVLIDPLPDSFENYAANLLKLVTMVMIDAK